jgi:NDP-sugar pyrophosphorylase family protein
LKAILITTKLYPEISQFGGGAGRRLPPLVDRPFLQHVVESIIDVGATDVEIILSTPSNAARELIGNGARWGVRVRYLENPRLTPYEALCQSRMVADDEPFLLAHSDLLPQIDALSAPAANTPVFYCWSDGGERWTGWALLRKKDLPFPGSIASPQQYLDRIWLEFAGYRALLPASVRLVAQPLSMRTYANLIEAHLKVLQKQHQGLLWTGREVSPHVWISRNVTIHRTTELIPPVFIGENSRLSVQTRIGPSVAIGRDCLIDRQTTLADSVVCPGSYVGEGLEFRDAYIDRNRLVNARLLAEVENVDEVLLGSVYGYGGLTGRKAGSWIA